MSDENARVNLMTPRKYEQRARAEAAAETRQRILDAVYARLRQAPSEAISVDEVARLAGVARSTVYAIFDSRAGLFDAIAADVFDRAGYGRLLTAVRVDDPRESLRGGLVAGTEVFAAERDVFRALFSTAQLDPDAFGGAIQRIEEERAAGMAWVARRLRLQNHLRAGVSESQASHIAWVLTSFDAFDLIYTGRNLSVAKTAEVLIGMAERAIFR
jgi:AcrR family transcriptional regulator